ncbi:MAG: DNA-binding protein [Pseudomonadota bacterium]
MKDYDFILKFDLPDHDADPEQFVEALYESGCDDASVGIGQQGRIALNFIRQSESALKAILSAISDVKKAIPGVKLIEATPDLVGLTDIADILGFSRQNMRKIAITNKSVFPTPVHEGSVALWHLFKVLQWFKVSRSYDIEDSLIEISNTNMQVNLASQMRDIDPKLQHSLKSIIA